MAQVELWVRLKVVDLVAQTAWMTFIEKLALGDLLRGLVHYSYWRMDAEGAGKEDLLEEIDRVIRMDSAFTNQNKHYYRLLVAGKDEGVPTMERLLAGAEIRSRGDLVIEEDFPRGDGGEVYALDLLVREKDTGREEAYLDRLNARLDGVRVTQLQAGEVWRLLIRAKDAEDAAGKAQELAVTRSRREGLLLNPHYQEYEIISAIRIGQEEGVK
jgi:hypothetical protein